VTLNQALSLTIVFFKLGRESCSASLIRSAEWGNALWKPVLLHSYVLKTLLFLIVDF
jgi:hypothetical protein